MYELISTWIAMIHLKIMSEKPPKARFVTLDILRGYFMLVIIVDHLNRFPSWFAWITGQGRLWVSAGEGFFIISGLLVGYTRGYKKLDLPMKSVTKLLVKRAFVLYLCSVIMSSILLLLTLHGTFPPSLQPSVVVPENSTITAIWQILTLQYVFEWVYFLKLYVAALLLAPVFIWLLRKKHTALSIMLSFMIWGLGYITKQDWLQWQILFFIPSVLGFHLETVRTFWRAQTPKVRRLTEYSLLGITFVALSLSSFWVFGWELVKKPGGIMSFDAYIQARQTIDPIFARVQLSIGRILLAFICFAGLYVLFNKAYPFIKSYTNWLLMPFGKNSLIAYIIHGLILFPIQVYVPLSTCSTFNTLLAAAIILTVYFVSNLKLIRKYVPS